MSYCEFKVYCVSLCDVRSSPMYLLLPYVCDCAVKSTQCRTVPFQVSPMRRTKLHTLVKFPITDLDMTSHVERCSPAGDLSVVSEGDENIYDLYSVSNHHGGMAGGHYTAYCLNPVCNEWNSYDDQFIQPLKESAIVSRGAYLLFYVKRNPNSANSAQQFRHWVDQMPQFRLQPETPDAETGDSSANCDLVESAV